MVSKRIDVVTFFFFFFFLSKIKLAYRGKDRSFLPPFLPRERKIPPFDSTDYARPRRWPKSQTTDRHNFRSLGLHRSATPGSGARSQPRMGWITSGLSSAALSSAASRSPFAYTSSGSWCVGLQSLPPQYRAKISQTAWTELW